MTWLLWLVSVVLGACALGVIAFGYAACIIASRPAPQRTQPRAVKFVIEDDEEDIA